MTAPAAGMSFAPLVARLDHVGLIEHSRGRVPAPEFGHCTDDAGRALALASSLSRLPGALLVASACIAQLERALQTSGRFVVRLDAVGVPTDDDPSDDADARAIWGLAAAVTSPLPETLRSRADDLLAIAHTFSSTHPRAAAQLVIAGARLHFHDARSQWADHLVVTNRDAVPMPRADRAWPWPESRLSYANGSIVEALLDLAVLRDPRVSLTSVLRLLAWLVDRETSSSGDFSFTPVGGRGPADPGGYDQQPIEAWTLAAAAARAALVANDPEWVSVVDRATAWFLGANDRSMPMWDPATGAAYDGLTANGVNLNQGTESTLALIGTVHAAQIAGQTVADAAIKSSR